MPSYLLKIVVLFCLGAALAGAAKPSLKLLKRNKPPEKTALDHYIQQAEDHARRSTDSSPGSLWSSSALFLDLGRDLRANKVDDVVTIVVSENTSAVATGATKTARTSAANSSISSLLGAIPATRPLPNLTKLSSQTTLDGQGSTSRQATLNANITARVTHVLPNSYLIVEGEKTVMINSENQVITVRGIVRPEDLSTANIVQSDRLGEMDVRVNGKGVVNDVARRPNVLYRLLLGLLPF